MTQEEKAKAYDEVVNKLRGFIRKGVNILITKADVQDFFPELKESEDGRIKKGIISILKHYKENGESICPYPFVSIDEAIAWIEKQEEHQKIANKEYTFKAIPRLLEMIQPTDRAKSYCQKLIDSLEQEGYNIDAKIIRERLKVINGENVAMAIMDEQKPVNNIEPKFHIGEWIVEPREGESNGLWHINRIEGNFYWDNFTGVEVEHADRYYHLWSFRDAINGDILTTPNYIYIFNSIDEKTKTVFYYCLMNKSNKLFSFDDYRIHGEILNSIPATKEQSNLFFSNMHKSGYKWDSVNFRVIGN